MKRIYVIFKEPMLTQFGYITGDYITGFEKTNGKLFIQTECSLGLWRSLKSIDVIMVYSYDGTLIKTFDLKQENL